MAAGVLLTCTGCFEAVTTSISPSCSRLRPFRPPAGSCDSRGLAESRRIQAERGRRCGKTDSGRRTPAPGAAWGHDMYLRIIPPSGRVFSRLRRRDAEKNARRICEVNRQRGDAEGSELSAEQAMMRLRRFQNAEQI